MSRPEPSRIVAFAALLGAALAFPASAADVRKPGGPPPTAARVETVPVVSIPGLPALGAPVAAEGLPTAPIGSDGIYASVTVPVERALPAAVPAWLAAGPEGLEASAPEAEPGAPHEQVKAEADRRFDLDGERTSGSYPVEAGPSGAPAYAALGPASSGAPAAAPAQPPAPRRPRLASRLWQEAKDRAVYSRIYFRQLWWYTVTHIVDRADRNMWPSYRERWKRAEASGAGFPVRDPRRFFAHMRAMGESGIFYVLGFSSLAEPLVMEESRATFRRYFDGPGVGPREAEAFERFMARAYAYNAEHRAHSKFRKHVRDALLAASQMSAERIAPYLDGLIQPSLAEDTARFQAEEQGRVLAAFRNAVDETVAEEPAGARGRVLGAILLGSFATGSPHRGSDFDLELVTEGGHRERMKPFMARLKARWKALGLDRHPVIEHESADPPSKGVVKRIHHREYLVLSPDPELVRALERAPGEEPYFTVERRLTWRGRLGRRAQFLAVYAATVFADLRDLRQ